MKVLFTSVGKSDPMTIFENCEIYDGSFLHIIRNYLPEKVYLYMSKEIVEFDKLDNRYEKVIQLFNELNGTNIEVEKIYREDLVEVQKFDIFYDDFENIIMSIINEYGNDTEILCNVSSGTPAMKATLQIISALSKYKLIPVQVSDPSRGRYKRDVDLNNYDVLKYWEPNLDNKQKNNRTYISKNDSFNFKIQKELLVNLINSYDYEAAYNLALDYRYRIDTKIIDLIKLALDRYNLKHAAALTTNNKYKLDLFPYRNLQQIELFEYVLWMKIKVEKGEVVDFLRGLNPFLYTACYKILKEKLNINIYDYCFEDKKGVKTLKIDKLQKDTSGLKILDVLNRNYRDGYRETFLSEAQMLIIIKELLSKENKLINSLNDLNSLKDRRNAASHQITAINKDDIKRQFGYSMEEYLEKVYVILKYLGYDTKQALNSYQEMNKYIVEEIKKGANNGL